jgi:hypothetical protein
VKRLRRASALETMLLVATVPAPVLTQGVIVRRPRMVGLAARLDADRHAVRRLRPASHPALPGRIWMSILANRLPPPPERVRKDRRSRSLIETRGSGHPTV